jgi:hypothetical protein
MQLEGLHQLKNPITSSPTVILILYSSKLEIDSLIKQQYHPCWYQPSTTNAIGKMYM